jgi:hypothetical protein
MRCSILVRSAGLAAIAAFSIAVDHTRPDPRRCGTRCANRASRTISGVDPVNGGVRVPYGYAELGKHRAVVDFPIPIEPVSPTIVRVMTKPPRGARHLNGRRVAEPALEARNRLMQQHSKAVDGLAALLFGLFQDLRAKRRVDDVGHDGGRSDPERSTPSGGWPCIPSDVVFTIRLRHATKWGWSSSPAARPWRRTVPSAHRRGPGCGWRHGQSARHHSAAPRRSPWPHRHCPRTSAGPVRTGPAGDRLANVGHETRPIGVIRLYPPLRGEGQRVGRPDQGGAVRDAVRKRKDMFLVRDRDVHALEPHQRQGCAGPAPDRIAQHAWGCSDHASRSASASGRAALATGCVRPDHRSRQPGECLFIVMAQAILAIAGRTDVQEVADQEPRTSPRRSG